MPYVFRKLSDLKNRARRVAREEKMPRYAALNLAAQRGGFQNYAHACICLPDDDAPMRHKIEIRQHWQERETRRHGAASFTMQLGTPLTELVRPHQLAEYLAGCELQGEAVLISDGFMRDRQETVIDIAKVARALQFMDVTGLKPSRAKRIYPKGNWYNRPPIADHDHGWFDPEARVHVLSTEPYLKKADQRPDQRAWETQHEWHTARSTWGSIYGFETELYLLCPRTYAAILREKVAKLERAGPAIRNEDIRIDE